MSTREQAVQILNQLTEEQLKENTESMKLDDFVKELGLQPDDLRVRDSEKKR